MGIGVRASWMGVDFSDWSLPLSIGVDIYGTSYRCIEIYIGILFLKFLLVLELENNE